jgi:hypothetical protein
VEKSTTEFTLFRLIQIQSASITPDGINFAFVASQPADLVIG